MSENIFTRLAASRRTIDPDVVRYGLRHIAFAAAILALSMCARAGLPLDSLSAIDPDTNSQAAAPASDFTGGFSGGFSGGIGKPLVEVPRTMLLFHLSVRGSLLYLDWKDDAEVQAVRIHDLRGRLLFTWSPASEAGDQASAAIGRWVWDGRDAHGSRLEPGRYLIRVQTRTGTRNQVFAWGRDR